MKKLKIKNNHFLNINLLLFLIIIIISLFRFINLNEKELQPWDESLYAVRSRSIVQTGELIDQTNNSLGGLYSSSHPPLYIWLSAFLVKTIGDIPISYRLWSTFFSLATILLVFYIPKKRIVGFFSSLALGINSLYFDYSQQGQLDTIFPFFIILGMFFWIKYEDKKNIYFLLLISLSLTLALLSKIIVGFFLPISIFFYLFYLVLKKERSWKTALKEFLIIFGLGIIIPLIWMIYMYILNGSDFLNYYFFFHIFKRSLTGVESNTQPLGVFYYFNQLPLILSTSFAIILFVINKTIVSLKKKNINRIILYFIFFLVPFIVFSISKTKLRTYAIPMIIPLTLIVGEGLYILWKEKKIPKYILPMIVFFLIWASTIDIRESFKHFAIFDYKFLIILLYLIICYFLSKYIRGKIFVLIFFIFLLTCEFLIPKRIFYKSDIQKTAESFFLEDYKDLYYIDQYYHVVNPQIAYYFNGININNLDTTYNFYLINPDINTSLENFILNKKAYIIFHQFHFTPDFLLIEKKLNSLNNLSLVTNNMFYKVYIYKP